MTKREAKILVMSAAGHARVAFRRWVEGSTCSRASRPMKSRPNFTKDPQPSSRGVRQ